MTVPDRKYLKKSVDDESFGAISRVECTMNNGSVAMDRIFDAYDSPSVSQGTTSKAVVQQNLTNLLEKSRKQSYISDRKDGWNLVSMELHI
ncbi:hypothetical protein Tco_1203919 [Tanacetum coccineum]